MELNYKIAFILIYTYSINLFAQTNNNYTEIQSVITNYRDSLSKYNYKSVINVLEENGKSTLTSIQIKGTSWDRVGYRLKKEKQLSDLLYIYPKPNNVHVDENKETILEFPIGGFSIISQDNIEKQLTYIGDTIIYRTDSLITKDGFYGVTVKPANIYKLSYGWQIPDCFEIISYKCNRIGNWQRQKNFIHYVGNRGDNNFLFEIKFRRKLVIPSMLFDRNVTYNQTIEVFSKNIEIVIKDPQQLDGDIISLNLNGNWIIKGFELSKSRTKLIVPLVRNENYLILHAENVGTISPNTAEIEVRDGNNIHKVVLNSEMGKSEGILLKVRN